MQAVWGTNWSPTPKILIDRKGFLACWPPYETTAVPHIYPYNLFPCIKIQNKHITMTKLSGQESLTLPVGDYDRRPESDMHIQRCKVHLVRVNSRLLFMLGQSGLVAVFPLDRQHIYFLLGRRFHARAELSPLNIRRGTSSVYKTVLRIHSRAQFALSSTARRMTTLESTRHTDDMNSASAELC